VHLQHGGRRALHFRLDDFVVDPGPDWTNVASGLMLRGRTERVSTSTRQATCARSMKPARGRKAVAGELRHWLASDRHLAPWMRLPSDDLR